jgi:hypothetical protein
VVDRCEHGNKHLSSIKCGEFFVRLCCVELGRWVDGQ